MTNFWTNSLRKLAGVEEETRKPKPKGYSARANVKVTKYFADKPRRIGALNENWNIYSQSEVPFAAITSLSYNAVGDWQIICSDTAVKQDISRFLRKTNFDDIVLDVVRDACVFGDAFVEKIYYEDGELAELKIRDPRTFQIEIDEKGNITKYVQSVGEESIDLEPNEVVHYQLFSDPSSPYGLALLDPSKDTMKRKTVADEGIAAAMDRHGFPKYHIVMKTPKGYEDELPTSAEIESIASDFKNINTRNEIVTSELIEIRPLDSKGVQNVDEYFTYFQSSVTCGVLVPQEVLGLGSGSTEATARVRRLMFAKLVSGFQKKIARATEINVLEELVDKDVDVKLVFSDAVPEDDKLIAESLEKIMPRGDPFAILTRDEIRERLGYPPLELAEKSRKAVLNTFGVEQKEVSMEHISDLEEVLKRYSDKVRSTVQGYL